MKLLSSQDPVYVVDLSANAIASCEEDFSTISKLAGQRADKRPPRNQRAPQTIEALALVFDWEQDAVLFSIQPTRDLAMLDALARLLRAAMITGHSVAWLATEAGDASMKRLFFSRAFPRFIYDGISPTIQDRIPERLRSALGRASQRR